MPDDIQTYENENPGNVTTAPGDPQTLDDTQISDMTRAFLEGLNSDSVRFALDQTGEGFGSSGALADTIGGSRGTGSFVQTEAPKDNSILAKMQRTADELEEYSKKHPNLMKYAMPAVSAVGAGLFNMAKGAKENEKNKAASERMQAMTRNDDTRTQLMVEEAKNKSTYTGGGGLIGSRLPFVNIPARTAAAKLPGAPK